MESKIMVIWPLLLLFSILFSMSPEIKTNNKEQNNKTTSIEPITHKSNGMSTTEKRNIALNRIILLYNEDYIYYYKSMNKYLNNKLENVRDVQQYLNRGKCKYILQKLKKW